MRIIGHVQRAPTECGIFGTCNVPLRVFEITGHVQRAPTGEAIWILILIDTSASQSGLSYMIIPKLGVLCHGGFARARLRIWRNN